MHIHATVIKCLWVNFFISVCLVVCLQWIAWIPCAPVVVCVCAVSVCVPQAGEVRAVRRHFLPVKNNVQVMERTKPRQGCVCVSRAGVATTAPQVSYNQCTHTNVHKGFLRSSYQLYFQSLKCFFIIWSSVSHSEVSDFSLIQLLLTPKLQIQFRFCLTE